MSRLSVRSLFLCVGAAVSAVRLVAQCPDGTPPPCRGARAAAAPVPPTSLAVLYFDNLSRDSADAFLADGLTEELIARLGQIERLTVKSRTAVQRLRGRPLDDPAAIGRTLAVAHLVSGSVRRSGARLRVTAELTRASTGVQVWSQTFDRASDGLMGVESEIAQAIATGVGGRLAPTERRTLAARPTTDPEAYEHFVRGNVLLARRTPEDMRRAIAQFELAAARDPSFARARARAALGYGLFIDWGWPYPGLPRDSVLARLARTAGEALALDSTSGDVWMAQGMARVFRDPRTFAGVVEAFERGLAVDPRNAELMHQFGGWLACLGDLARAEQLWRAALALDPDRPITLQNMARARVALRRDDEARLLLDSALRLDPGATYARETLGWLALSRGDVASARAQVDSATRIGTPDRNTLDPLRAAVAAHGGDSATARGILVALERDLPVDAVNYWHTAGLAAGWLHTGDPDRALDILERGMVSGYMLWESLRQRRFDPLREHPRFQRIVEAIRPPGAR